MAQQNGGEQQTPLAKVLEAADKAASVQTRELDSFAQRAEATAAACDELANYCKSFSQHMRKASADFASNVAEMMGRIRG